MFLIELNLSKVRSLRPVSNSLFSKHYIVCKLFNIEAIILVIVIGQVIIKSCLIFIFTKHFINNSVLAFTFFTFSTFSKPIRGLRYIRGETSRSASPNVRRHAAGRHVSRAIRRHEARSSS